MEHFAVDAGSCLLSIVALLFRGVRSVPNRGLAARREAVGYILSSGLISLGVEQLQKICPDDSKWISSPQRESAPELQGSLESQSDMFGPETAAAATTFFLLRKELIDLKGDW